MTKPPPIDIEFNVTCPDPADLRTGDLVFPRGPKQVQAEQWETMLRKKLDVLASTLPVLDSASRSDLQGQQMKVGVTVRQAVGPLLTLVKPDLPVVEMVRPAVAVTPIRLKMLRDLEGAREGNKFDPFDPLHVLLVLFILKDQFEPMLEKWLGLDLWDFLRHPIARIIIGGLSDDRDAGIFVGHVGLVVREEPAKPGDPEKLMVYEGNVTDFSAYETRAKLYHDARDPAGATAEDGLMRGWAGYRHALGNSVWSARPKLLHDLDTKAQAGDAAAGSDAQRIRHAIRRHAKELLGIGYAFFDHPQSGDPGRLYCSEYVRLVLQRAGRELKVAFPFDDNVTWNWMVEHIEDPAFKAQVEAALDHDPFFGDPLRQFVDGKEFPIYTVQMAWRTASVHKVFMPKGAEYG